MNDLDGRLRAADRIAAPDLWPDITSRRAGPPPDPSPGPGRRAIAAAVALALAAGGGALLVRAFGGMGREVPAPPEPATQAPPDAALPPAELVVTGVLDAGGPVTSVEAGEGTVFVAVSANDGSSGGHVLALDPGTGATAARIPVDTVPSWEVGGQGMAASDGVLWVGGGNDGPERGGLVLAIDVAAGRVVDRVELDGGFVADVTISGDELWVLVFGDGEAPRVVRMDRATLEVTRSVELAPTYVRQIVHAVGGIWVHHRMSRGSTVTDSLLTRMDPATGTIDVDVPLGGYAHGFEAVGDSLWAAASDSEVANVVTSLFRIDATTGEELDRFPMPVTLEGRELFAVSPDGALWLVGSEDDGARLYRFDPAEGRLDASVSLPADLTPVALSATASSVWIANYEGSVTKVEVRPAEAGA